MNKKKIYKKIAASFICMSVFGINCGNAQNVIEVAPLFEYPVAPEELPDMYEKSNYLVEHFWDKMDLKSKQAVDQNALNHAFHVYSVAMRFADRNICVVSNQKLVNTLSKNPTLLLQFTKAAEENIYGMRADFWIDEIYIQYLKALLSSKKVSPSRKQRYEKQLVALENTSENSIAPKFSFENRNGSTTNYFPMSTPTMIIFGNPWDTDWRMARLGMESDLSLVSYLDKGKINILFILPEFRENWQAQVNNYSDKWIVGFAENVDKIYDIRVSPAIYVIGSDGKIISKNTSLQTAVHNLLQQIKE